MSNQMNQQINGIKQPKIKQQQMGLSVKDQQKVEQVDVGHVQQQIVKKQQQNIQNEQEELKFQQQSQKQQQKLPQAQRQNNNIQNQILKQFLQRQQKIIAQIFYKYSQSTDYINLQKLYPFFIEALPKTKIEFLNHNNKNLFQIKSQNQLFQDIATFIKQFIAQNININKTQLTLSEVIKFLHYLLDKQNLNIIVYDHQLENDQNIFNQQEQDQEKPPGNQQKINLKIHLLKTKQQYQELLNNKNLSITEKKVLTQTLQSIKLQIKDLQSQPSKQQNSIQQNSQNSQSNPQSQTKPQKSINITSYLQIIFEYYCKQTYNSKSPTFQRIMHQTNVLTINKFISFTKDFQLLGKLKIPQIQEIFKKNSQNSKQMNFQGFKNALQKIAQKLYQNQSDPIKQLYIMMQIDNQQNLKAKLKILKIPFSLKQQKKILTKQSQYKFKYMAHGGKLAQDIKNFIQQKKKIKLQKQKQKIRDKLLQQKRKNLIFQKKPPRQHEEQSFQQPIFNNQHQNQQHLGPLNQIYQQHDKTKRSSAKMLSGYSEIYKNRNLKGSKFTNNNINNSNNKFQLNNIVQEARAYIKLPESRQESYEFEQKVNLDSLIQDDDEDDYLQQHWKMQESNNKQSITQKLTNRLNQIKKIQMQKDKRLNKISSSRQMGLKLHN